MESTKIQTDLFQVYDYIVVGAGASGCVVASRLSEDPDKTVLILEAGEDDGHYPNITIPGRAGDVAGDEVDWGFNTVPQQNAYRGYKNQVYNSVCGKVLGGSSSLNYLVYMRGTPHDYDTWNNMGCTGWAYKDVLPYFKKSENCLVNKLVDNGFHGTSGPMAVSQSKVTPLGDIFVEGGKSLGYQQTDCNSDNPLGFMTVQSNIGDGIRQSSSHCFLKPASHRPNLHIATKAYTSRVLIYQNVVRGVEFYHDGVLKTVRARREVILSAGAYCTPQILMLSGIGPKDHLQALGIPVVCDLPVGNNLQEHTAVLGLEFEINKPLSLLPGELDSKKSQSMYQTQRTGPLSTGMLEATALIQTSLQDAANPNPDIQLLCLSGLMGTGKNGRPRNMVGMKDEIFNAIFEGKEGKHGFCLLVISTHSKSRGTVRLKSKDSRTLPLIDHQALSHQEDVAKLVEGCKFTLALTKTKPYVDIGARCTCRRLPGYERTNYTDEYWEEYVRTLTNTYHPAGTCRMGRVNDQSTVVDSQLRVKGIDGLRVADASVMPEITSANLNATCIMIGEKAADMIRKTAIPSKL